MKNFIQNHCRKTTKIFTAAFLSLFISGSVFSNPGSDLRALSSFNQIEISGAYKVVLIQGDKEQVLVEADDENLPKIISKVENGLLKIYNKEKINSSNSITLTITFKNINDIDCAGSVDISATTPLKLSELDMDLSGAAKINLDITANSVSIDISGAGNATLAGSAKKVDLDISGSGRFLATTLTAGEYDIDISGAGSAKVNATSKLNVQISGSGSVGYTGDPKITKEISGSGSVSKM